jgi:hypothetical protein
LIEWKLILVPILPAAVVWQLAIKRTVLWVLVLLILAMQFLVLAMLWALVVVMAQKVGMVARVEMAARKSGCYLTTERELLHRASYLQYLRLGIYFSFAHNGNVPKISLNKCWYSSQDL